MTITVLAITSFFTSIISALIGAGGGILLLSVLLFFFPLGVAVPIHGAVQLGSNITRIYAFRKNSNRKIILYFAIGVLPGAFCGFHLLSLFSREPLFEPLLKLLVAGYLLYSIFPKKQNRQKLSRSISQKLFAIAGVLSGIFGLLIGATGPLLAAFFIHSEMKKNEVIATKAGCQAITHLVKIPVFMTLDFSYFQFNSLIPLMVISVIFGTFTGRQLGKYLSESFFRSVFKFLIAVAGLKLLADSALYFSLHF